MEEPSDAFLLIATGAQNVGKTYKTFSDILNLAYGNIIGKKKTLIFDSNGNEYAVKKINNIDHKVDTLKHNSITAYGNFTGYQVRRIAPFTPTGAGMPPDEVIELLHKTTREFRNGVLVVEDFTTLIGDQMDAQTAGFLCNVRHRGVILILHLQSLDAILPKMRRNVKIIRMHYQMDSVAQTKHKLKDEYEIFAISEKMINKQYSAGNIHFFTYVYRMVKKIKGDFSNKMLTDAIMDYLSENRKVFKPLVEKVDNRGKKIYTFEQAMMVKTRELFYKYNGNLKK